MSSESPSTSPPAPESDEKPVYVKTGGKKDPVFRHSSEVILPALRAAIAAGRLAEGSRDNWIRVSPLTREFLDKPEWQQYNRGALESMIISQVKNKVGHPTKVERAAADGTITPASAPKPPRNKSAFEVYRETHSEEVKAAVEAELDKLPEDSKQWNNARPGATLKATRDLMEKDAEGVAEAEAAAKAHNDANTAPPAGHTLENQNNLPVYIQSDMGKRSGSGWGQSGNFFAWTVGVVLREDTQTLQTFNSGFTSGQRTTTFLPSVLQQLNAEAVTYAGRALQGNVPATPTFTADPSGKLVVPPFDVSAATAEELQQWLYAFLAAAPIEQLRDLWAAAAPIPVPVPKPANQAISFSSRFAKDQVNASKSPSPEAAPPPPPPRTPSPRPNSSPLTSPGDLPSNPSPPPPPPPKKAPVTRKSVGGKGKQLVQRAAPAKGKAKAGGEASGKQTQGAEAGSSELRRSKRKVPEGEAPPAKKRKTVSSGRSYVVIEESTEEDEDKDGN
uniref:Uncharacterized protein n=1 Tax=Mycena chlorophos TaxID=658473 RepID=A0ABQ0L344_MYCCL|nr:predicted protein [Mycena chlorophos]